MNTNISYIFNCPVHGREINILCFRAFDKNNRYLWEKYEISYKELPFDNDEKEKFINDLVYTASHH